jgi:hypothetical protein
VKQTSEKHEKHVDSTALQCNLCKRSKKHIRKPMHTIHYRETRPQLSHTGKLSGIKCLKRIYKTFNKDVAQYSDGLLTL